MFQTPKTYQLARILTLFSIVLSFQSKGQFMLDTAQVDTVAISYKKGFDVNDFIRMTKTDTSFYRAFKNLKMFPHQSESKVNIYDKKWSESAYLEREGNHMSNGKFGSVKITSEKTDGKVYKKNGEHKYFTAEMFDHVFFPKGAYSTNNFVGDPYDQNEMKGLSTKEKYKEKLKTFIFSPGTGVKGVPIIGKKLNIFDDRMAKFYDFKLEKTFFRDTIPCYKFSCIKKENVSENKVAITKLITFYDRRTMNIIARTYTLKDKNSMFSFDIKMFIELKYQFNEYLPVKIKYNGEWDVAFKKAERIKFQMDCKTYSDPKN